MVRKKEFLADIIFHSNMVSLFQRLPLKNKMIVFNYHRIRPVSDNFSTDFDDGVFNVDAGQFERQIRWLKDNTHVMSEEELVACYRDGSFSCPDISMPCVLITFDDGYKDSYTIAYPILKKYEVPAILFVATKMVNSRAVPWWDVISYLIKHCKEPFINYEGRQFSMNNQRKEAIVFFQQLMKQDKYENNKYLLSDISDICKVAYPAIELQDKEILSWEEIRELARNNIAIGSHTHTHRELTAISDHVQEEEMIISRILLEENIGRPVISIAYTVGDLHDIDIKLTEIAAKNGYLFGFTTNSGVNDWRNSQPMKIRRVANLLEKISTVSLMTILPDLFAWDSLTSSHMKMIKTRPAYADMHYRLGNIHLAQNMIEEAIANFEEAVYLNPNYIEARIRLGISQAIVGRYEGAENNLLFVISKKPSFADIYYYLGVIYASKKQISQAIQQLEKALDINPAYREAMLKLGVLYCQKWRYQQALDMLERASRLDPSDKHLLAIVEEGQNIIEKHGSGSSVFSGLFSSYIENSIQNDELVKRFITHLNISPNLNDIMVIIEKESLSHDNLNNLVILLQDYRYMFPEYPDIPFFMGILYKKLNRLNEAEDCFSESLRLNSSYVKARLNLFTLLKEQGRLKDALEHGYVLDRIGLNYPDLYFGLSETCLQLSMLSEAERFAEKALSIRPAYKKARELKEKIINTKVVSLKT